MEDIDPVPCPWCPKHGDETEEPPLLFSDYATWAAHVATMPSHEVPATASGRSRSTPKRKMEPDTTCHDVRPPSPPLDVDGELGGGVACTAEPKPVPEEHDSMRAIFIMPSPPLSIDLSEKDERELVRNEPKSPMSAKRTRVDVTDKMEGLDIDFGMPINPLLTNDGTSSDSWFSVGGAADTPEDEFVFVGGKDGEDVDVEDFQLEDDFCIVDEDDLDSDRGW